MHALIGRARRLRLGWGTRKSRLPPVLTLSECRALQWFAGSSLLFLGTNWRRAVVRINGVKVQRYRCGIPASQKAR